VRDGKIAAVSVVFDARPFAAMFEDTFDAGSEMRAPVDNAAVVRRFEHEFKSRSNFDIVNDLMTEDFVHHLPYDLPPGREGMKAVGHFVTGAFSDIEVSVDLVVAQGDLVADRISAHGVRTDRGDPADWVEKPHLPARGRPDRRALAGGWPRHPNAAPATPTAQVLRDRQGGRT
jgi:hypothetical protein